jgi:hypothetical protein
MEDIKNSDVMNFLSKVRAMSEQEFGTDEDGSLFVEVNAVNRQVYHRDPYFSVPYSHRACCEADMWEILSACNTNLGLATKALQIEMRMMEMVRRDKDADSIARMFERALDRYGVMVPE